MEMQQKVFLPSPHVQELLKQCFYTTKSIPSLFSSLYMDVATIRTLDQTSLPAAVPPSILPPDSILDVLPQLPNLHISLLISAARLDAIHNAAVITFALVYSHYVELVSRARLQASAAGSIAQGMKLWNQGVAAAAWEDLAEWELILPAAAKAGGGGGQAHAKLWRCDVVLEEIVEAVGGADAGMSEVMIKWCKEV
jgi:origin recognition complex subunit 4